MRPPPAGCATVRPEDAIAPSGRHSLTRWVLGALLLVGGAAWGAEPQRGAALEAPLNEDGPVPAVVLPTREAPSPWAPWLAVALGVGLAATVTPRNPDVRPVFAAVIGGSALARLTLQTGFLHVDGDDLAFAAAVLDDGADATALENSTGFRPAALGLFRAATWVGGEHVRSLFLPALVCGVLLPALVTRLAWTWTRDVGRTLAAGAFATLSPVVLAYGGSTSVELPAATLLTGAVVLTRASAGNPLRTAAAAALVVPAIVAAVALKEEFVVWAGAAAIVAVWGPGRPGRAAAAAAAMWAVGVAAAIVSVRDAPEQATAIASWRLSFLGPTHLLWYLGAGVLLLNPPWPPLSWAFARDLVRPPAPGLRPLQVHVVLLVGMYATASMAVGPNHARYHLGWLAPFAVAISPDLVRWWRQRRTVRGRMIWALLVLAWAFGWAVWRIQLHQPRQRDLAWAADFDGAGTLVVYANHAQDRSVGPTLRAVGGLTVVPATALWPAPCPAAVDAALVRVRTTYKDVEFRTDDRSQRFRDLDALDADLDAFADVPRDDAVRTMQAEVDTWRDRVRGRLDLDACRDLLPRMRSSLARFDRIVILRDAESAPLAWERWAMDAAPFTDDHLAELVDVTLDALEVGEDPGTLGAVEVHAVPHPLDPSAPPVWTRR